MTEDVVHYQKLAPQFEDYWSYSPEFVGWMTDSLVEHLGLTGIERVVDIGCATALYARGIVKHASEVVCVDPSVEMLAQIPTNLHLVPVCGTAEEVACCSLLAAERFDAVLLKEVIHHVRREAREAVLAGLARRLTPGGRLLVAMLPDQLDYPLFQAALDRYEVGTRKYNASHVVEAMRNADLDTEVVTVSFPLRIAKEHYLNMVRGRYMSLFSKFDDEQLAAGLLEMDRAHPEEILEFTDRFAFVRGVAR